ncbi:hypothetical protein [Streptomyces sp. DG2A-72]|uniref:hypothetical protein n=1 Tax=Streptomyces sp. DG2A-72 TaxID=3051386 RepID=UPI0034639187
MAPPGPGLADLLCPHAGEPSVPGPYALLVPEKHEVRSLDQQYEVTWVGDTPSLAIAAEAQRGQVQTVSKRWTLGGGENGGTEATETFSFDSSDLKNPLQEAVLGAGWTWRGVITGKL